MRRRKKTCPIIRVEGTEPILLLHLKKLQILLTIQTQEWPSSAQKLPKRSHHLLFPTIRNIRKGMKASDCNWNRNRPNQRYWSQWDLITVSGKRCQICRDWLERRIFWVRMRSGKGKVPGLWTSFHMRIFLEKSVRTLVNFLNKSKIVQKWPLNQSKRSRWRITW